MITIELTEDEALGLRNLLDVAVRHEGMRAAIFAVTLDAKNWVKAIQKTLSSAAFKNQTDTRAELSSIMRPRNTRLSTPNVKHEARCVVRESEHRRTDAGKSNPRASASRRAAGLGCSRGLSRCGHLRRPGTKRTARPRYHAQGRPPAGNRRRYSVGASPPLPLP